MRNLSTSILVAATAFLSSSVLAHDPAEAPWHLDVPPVKVTDPATGIEFASYPVGEDLVIGGFELGVALPQNLDKDEYIGRITGARTNGEGWTGVTHGDSMLNNVLLVAWVDGDKVVTSFRFATEHMEPEMYDGDAKLTQIAHTINDTHFTLTYKCENCFSWTFNGQSGKQDIASAEIYFGFAQSSMPVVDPADALSPIQFHDLGWGMIATIPGLAANPSYATWASNGTAAATVPAEKLRMRRRVRNVNLVHRDIPHKIVSSTSISIPPPPSPLSTTRASLRPHLSGFPVPPRVPVPVSLAPDEAEPLVTKRHAHRIRRDIPDAATAVPSSVASVLAALDSSSSSSTTAMAPDVVETVEPGEAPPTATATVDDLPDFSPLPDPPALAYPPRIPVPMSTASSVLPTEMLTELVPEAEVTLTPTAGDDGALEIEVVEGVEEKPAPAVVEVPIGTIELDGMRRRG